MDFRIKIILLLAFIVMFTGCIADGDAGRLDDATERKIAHLISQMNITEKVGQLNQLSSYGSADAMSDILRGGAVGSILNETNPETINAMQRIAIEESRLGIPILFARDIIHGYRTIFPIPLGLAATFDPALVEQGAGIAAAEASANGIRWTFSPMVDVSRDARWGRIAESSGEDTYLNSIMGAAMVRGYQNGDPQTSIAACVKHFVGYGASEGGRDYNTTHIPAREMREVYLPPFETAVKEGSMTAMTSFNANDGIPSTGNRWLVNDLLRGEWGFGGMVVSDWNSIGEMIAHGYAADGREAAIKGFDAGVDMDMMSYLYTEHLANLVKDGTFDETQLDKAVRTVLRLKFRLGLFDNPYANLELMKSRTYATEHLEAARVSAERSAVLLKNEDCLPLDASRTRRIFVTGPMADAPYEQLGTWTFDGEKEHTVTPLDALRETYGKEMEIVYDPCLSHSREICGKSKLDNMTAKAASCDVVLVFVGEEAILSGEAHCLANLDLQGSQSELIAAMKRSGRPVVTVVMAGRPLTIKDDLENTDALLYSFHPGTMGGPALVNLIFGKVSPSGKLPVTFPVSVGQIPYYYNHYNTGRPSSGKELLLPQIPLEAGQTSLGCTTYLLDDGFGPLFPFGYGLTYTSFEYDAPVLDRSEYGKNDTIHVTCRVTNTGKREAEEVVQLYVRDDFGSVVRPVRELKGFRRVKIAARESADVEFDLPVADLAFWTKDMRREVEAGSFCLWVSTDSASGEPTTFNVR